MYKIDAFIGHKVFSEEQKSEEEKYTKDVVKSLEAIKEILKQLENCSLADENEFCDVIVNLYIKLSNVSWYFDNLHENLRKIIENYPLSEKFHKENSLD